MGDAKMVDTMITDGLWDAFNGYHMGNTAENVAQQWQITREQQDRFAAGVAAEGGGGAAARAGSRTRSSRSRSRAARATSWSTPTSIRSRTPRIEVLAKLRPAFDKDGTVTAGNASGLNDGAAALVLMSAEEAAAPRPHAARPHRLLGHGRRRPGGDGLGPDPGQPRGAEEGRLDGRATST